MDANYKPYKRYDDEFKRSAVDLLETSGRPIAEVAGDFGSRIRPLNDGEISTAIGPEARRPPRPRTSFWLKQNWPN